MLLGVKAVLATGWTVVDPGVVGTWYGIWGSAPNDFWVVGNGGVAIHWNGATWSQVDSNTSHTLNGVWGSGPNEVWAVGAAVVLSLLVGVGFGVWPARQATRLDPVVRAVPRRHRRRHRRRMRRT